MTDPHTLASQIAQQLWDAGFGPRAAARRRITMSASEVIERVLRAHQDAQDKNLSDSVIAGTEFEGSAGKPQADRASVQPAGGLSATSEHIESLKTQLTACVQERDRLRGALEQLDTAQGQLNGEYVEASWVREIVATALVALPPT